MNNPQTLGSACEGAIFSSSALIRRIFSRNSRRGRFCGWVTRSYRSCSLRVAHIRDPVALAARQSRLDGFVVERGGNAPQKGSIHVVECVDVDDRVEVIVDLARDYRRHAAAGADAEEGRARSEG